MSEGYRGRVLECFQQALEGTPCTFFDEPGATAVEMIVVAEELKAEHAPKYNAVQLRMTGPNSLTFELDPGEKGAFGHGDGTEGT